MIVKLTEGNKPNPQVLTMRVKVKAKVKLKMLPNIALALKRLGDSK